MKITTRALVLAVAMIASAPLLAASSGTSTADTDASTQEIRTTTGQDDSWLPTLPSTDLSGDLDRLPTPGSTSPDTAGVHSVTAMPAGGSTAWLRQGAFLDGLRVADDLSVVPAKAGIHFWE